MSWLLMMAHFVSQAAATGSVGRVQWLQPAPTESAAAVSKGHSALPHTEHICHIADASVKADFVRNGLGWKATSSPYLSTLPFLNRWAATKTASSKLCPHWPCTLPGLRNLNPSRASNSNVSPSSHRGTSWSAPRERE